MNATNKIVPHGIDKVLVATVFKLVPNLDGTNKQYIIKALRYNYHTKGFVYKKVSSFIQLKLIDLYAAFIADNRHRFTNYEKEFNQELSDNDLKKEYNNHNYAKKVFGKYHDIVWEKYIADSEAMSNNVIDSLKWNEIFVLWAC